MLFNSIPFAIFLPIVFGLYWWLGKKGKGLLYQNILLLVSSYVFYGWWDARLLGLIFISSLTDYLAGIQMGKIKEKKDRRKWLALSLGVNLGMLGFFKYYNFFATNLVEGFSLMGIELDPFTLNIILPVGISFYTFQTLSYTIDIYRGTIRPTSNVVDFFAYVSFFPQLVAGPIEKARDLLPQFRAKRQFSYPLAVSGLRLILYGILKKVLVADRLGEYVNQLHSNPGDYQGWDIVIGAIFFTVQIYCDFSGYSDIALGTARLFGFNLSINFRTPLFSTSTAEFWRRWHISLNAWFRDYVYVPLGGRKKGMGRFYLNMFIVFLVSAVWHGAGWTYIAWGMICAVFYLAEGLVGHPRKTSGVLADGLGWIWAVGGFCLSLLFFRAKTIGIAWDMLCSLDAIFFSPPTLFMSFESELNLFLTNTEEYLFLTGLLMVFFAFEFLIGKRTLDHVLDKWPRPARWIFYYISIALTYLFGAYGVPQQFIYFQF